MNDAVHTLLKALCHLEKKNRMLYSTSGASGQTAPAPLADLPFIELSLRPNAKEAIPPEEKSAPFLGSGLVLTHVSDALLKMAGLQAPLANPTDIFTTTPWALALLCSDAPPALNSAAVRIRKVDGSSIPAQAFPLPEASSPPRDTWRLIILPVDPSSYDNTNTLAHAMAENMADLQWAKDLNGRYLFANKATRETLLCYEDADLLGRDDIYFARRQQALDRRHTIHEHTVANDFEVLESCTPTRFLEEGYAKDEYLALEVQKGPLYAPQGVLIGTVGTARNITRQKQAEDALRRVEQHFELVLRATNDVLWHYDIASDTLTCNKIAEQHLPQTHSEHARPSLPTKDIERANEYVRRFFKEGGDNLQHECKLQNADGKVFWLLTRGSVIERDEKNTPLLAVGAHADITELKAAESAADSATRAKSAFLATMSHEIRTPLNGVLGMLQVLSSEYSNGEQRKIAHAALDSGRKLLSIINDILDFSSIDASTTSVKAKPFCIRDAAQSALETFRQEAQRKNLDLSCTLDAGLPDLVVGDEQRIRQILFNIISNAIKFTCKGFVRLTISSLQASGPEDIRLLIGVEDSGIGIAPEILPHIFDPFFQADGSYRRRYQGTGLGLGIVHSLVSMMHGSISVESTPGTGTTVYCSIVLKKAALHESPGLDVVENPPPKLAPTHILLAEDEYVNQVATTYLLEKDGHTVTIATDGPKVIKLLRTHTPDCILMDIQMPGMDGMDVTKAIRSGVVEGVQKIPIIALTAHALTGDKEMFLESGMDGYLSKPIDADALRRELHRVLYGKLKAPRS